MDDPVLDIHIREDDPLFGRVLGLANEVVAGLVYGVMEASGTATVSLPTLSAAVNEINAHPDPRLLGMFVFALGRCARNMALALARERASSQEEVLRAFLLPRQA